MTASVLPSIMWVAMRFRPGQFLLRQLPGTPPKFALGPGVTRPMIFSHQEGPERRAQLIGLPHEIYDEQCFDWSIRNVCVALALDPNVQFPLDAGTAQYLGSKYGYRPAFGPKVCKRTIDVL